MFACDIRDPIHRTIGVEPEDVPLVDHPFVQRLRQIRQLGVVFLVYPGATHDRFSHSLGAMHVANRLWASVVRRDGSVLVERYGAAQLPTLGRILRRAALLHDTGHPPFSHVAEAFLPPLSEVAIPAAWWRHGRPERETRHEDISIVLISALSSGPGALLSPEEAQDIASLVHKDIAPSPAWAARFGVDDSGLHDVMRSFVSGELDCDRMDYLLRDAYMAGTVYGNYDLDRLLEGQGLAMVSGRLARYVDANAVRSFEDYLLARYHMFLQVYQHKTAVGFDICLTQAIRTGEIDLALPGDAAAYVEWRDGAVIEALHAASRREGAEWSRRFVRREPLKLLMSAEGARPADQTLLQHLRAGLEEVGVAAFEVNSRQYLSRLPLVADGTGLLASRKLLGRRELEPLANYSDLLKQYAGQVDLTHLFVRREDLPRVTPMLERLPRA
jgi:HD superfamily phosphohydrolase